MCPAVRGWCPVAKPHGSVRIGPISLFTLIIILCLAVLAVLAVLAAAYVLAYPYSTFVLAAIALSLFWLIACFAAWPGLERYVFHISEEKTEE